MALWFYYCRWINASLKLWFCLRCRKSIGWWLAIEWFWWCELNGVSFDNCIIICITFHLFEMFVTVLSWHMMSKNTCNESFKYTIDLFDGTCETWDNNCAIYQPIFQKVLRQNSGHLTKITSHPPFFYMTCCL